MTLAHLHEARNSSQIRQPYSAGRTWNCSVLPSFGTGPGTFRRLQIQPTFSQIRVTASDLLRWTRGCFCLVMTEMGVA